MGSLSEEGVRWVNMSIGKLWEGERAGVVRGCEKW